MKRPWLNWFLFVPQPGRLDLGAGMALIYQLIPGLTLFPGGRSFSWTDWALSSPSSCSFTAASPPFSLGKQQSPPHSQRRYFGVYAADHLSGECFFRYYQSNLVPPIFVAAAGDHLSSNH
ncbi:MAG: hypothetical protein M5U34_03010 [Chloroflexi bacterium]|nr:hypothetical protein [Chloroflexota bacterium]